MNAKCKRSLFYILYYDEKKRILYFISLVCVSDLLQQNGVEICREKIQWDVNRTN